VLRYMCLASTCSALARGMQWMERLEGGNLAVAEARKIRPTCRDRHLAVRRGQSGLWDILYPITESEFRIIGALLVPPWRRRGNLVGIP
jgi:hypothetical protein